MGTLFRPLIRARTWKETLHLLIDLPLGIAWFTIIVTGIALGVGLVPLMFLGLLVLLLTLQFVRVVSAIERARAKALLDADIANPFMPLGEIQGWWSRIKAVLGDAALWKGVAYCVLALPVGIITFTVAVTFWSIALGGVTAPIWATIEAMVGSNDPHGWAYVGLTAASFVAGLIFLVGTPWVIHGLAVMDRGLIRGLLGADRNAQLRRRVTQLEVSKTASLDVAEAERTRIERDLHDGVQPRLVVAAMDLGLAREKASGSDPEVVALIERAQDETKQAIAELRELVRGIHPAVLTDRGLDAALSSLAARCPVPVTVQVNLDERPPTPVESAAYFIVAESLTNIAKHSDAKHARVNVNRDDGLLRVEVTDDGKGGARTEPGGGLSGLADRVRSLEGTFRVASPDGGPTTILAELPCGS
ncbi:MAG TPA: sensor histidine kinase [Ilumatobacteraceae bacterium]|nr:sensor histidine kinase [Ilumatobacteraceae bacterium]